MKTYDQFTEKQKENALDQALTDLLTAICDGLRFNDEANGDDLQERIDKAFDEAEKMQTPWFAHEYLMADEYIRECLEGIARADAEESLYPEKGENVIYIGEI